MEITLFLLFAIWVLQSRQTLVPLGPKAAIHPVPPNLIRRLAIISSLIKAKKFGRGGKS